MKTVDFEMVVTCGIMALAAALGIVAAIIVFLGISFQECSPALVAGGYFAMSGLIWGSLLILNHDKMSLREP